MSATTHDDKRIGARDRMHVPRSKGATSGLLLVLLGIWGALVPFIGPYFDYAYTPDATWHFTWGRLWLEILPGAAVFLGGLFLLGTANRVSGSFGAWLAAAGGAWFVVGQPISQLWNNGIPAAGLPASASTLGKTVEQIGFFSGLGVVAVFLAATALGRMSVVGVRDLRDRGTAKGARDDRYDERRDDRYDDRYDDTRDTRGTQEGSHRGGDLTEREIREDERRRMT